MSSLTPREIVLSLDKHIVGQTDAKKAVAIALRNRWRRQRLPQDLKEEVLPKNILMIGPTGVGKTEIARRLARLADAPFLKVEATKFTEVGYVGRDVEQIIRDLVEVALKNIKELHRNRVEEKAKEKALRRVLEAMVGTSASDETNEKFRSLLVSGALDDKEVTLDVQDSQGVSMPTMDVPGMPGAQMGMINLGDIFGKALGKNTKQKTLRVHKALKLIQEEEADKLIDAETMVQEAIEAVEQNSIVFIDEIDKIATQSSRHGGDVSREGVQRDLLPLIEGTSVATKHGVVKTDHILFIASGAFHVAKPSDLLPELQGRLPIRVELKALSQQDFKRILTEPQANLIHQYQALMHTENVALTFDEDALDALASIAATINQSVENIGARRLHTVLERLLEDISFDGPERAGTAVHITKSMVHDRLDALTKNQDLSKFIL